MSLALRHHIRPLSDPQHQRYGLWWNKLVFRVSINRKKQILVLSKCTEATEDSALLPHQVRIEIQRASPAADLVTVVLCWYEHIITLGEEVRCVWKKRISAASVLFLLNRYLTLVSSLVSVVLLLPWPSFPEVAGFPYTEEPVEPYNTVGIELFMSTASRSDFVFLDVRRSTGRPLLAGC